MKKTLIKAFSLLLAFLILLFVSSCKEDIPDTSEDDGFLGSDFTQDKLGYNRPENCWLADSLLLPTLPEDVTELFGTGGESHILSDYAIENDGKIEVGKTAYLVYLVYGTPAANTGADTYLKFSLIDEKEILYDDDFITFGEPSHVSVSGHYKFSYDVDSSVHEWRLRFSKDDKTAQSYAESIYFDKAQFVFVQPFKLNREGTLCVDCRIDADGEFSRKFVAEPYFLSLEAEKPYKAKTSDLSVGYLTEAEYNSGSFSDSDIKPEPNFNDSKNCYLVADFSYSALNANKGDSYVNFMVRSTGRGMLDITIDDAPTANFFETGSEFGMTLGAAFKLPENAGEEKKVRVIVRLKSVSGGGADFDVFLSGSENVSVEGERYVPQSLETGPLSLIFKLNSDKKSYSLEKIYGYHTSLEIPEKAPDGLPITRIMDYALSYGSVLSITVPSTVTVIDENVFYTCGKQVVEIVNNSSVDIEGMLNGYEESVRRPLDIHAGVANIREQGAFAFYTLDGKSYLVGYNGEDENVILPNDYNGKSYEIYDYAFRGARAEKFVIPEGVEVIGEFAFEGCSFLKEVHVPFTVKRIERSAFYLGVIKTFDVYVTDLEAWLNITFADRYSYPLSEGGNLYLNGELVQDPPKPSIPEAAEL